MHDMTIKNDTDRLITWLCYDHADPVKLFALSSGRLDQGACITYNPPETVDGLYAIRFSSDDENALAIGVVQRNGQIVLKNNNNRGFWVETK